MPSSMLFALNNEGKVFGLATNGTKWREFPYLSLDFKQISAVPHFLWAVGGDRQIYVHVHGLDIPIRVKEESYENQRWFPIEGFSKRLLPTDRYPFSNHDGTVDRTLEKIRVPSMAWQWESEWHVETTLDGEPLDHDGWTYAVDFPVTFYSTKQWSSCVRRRKWVRSRRYCAMNSWCAVAPLHKDPTQEPFIYVSVGGQSMSGAAQGALQVWAVTAQGRVMWRKGVGITCPEGTRWSCIPLPAGKEVRSLSCGTTGLVWAVLWTGNILVREGITPGNPMGDGWTEVEAPDRVSEVSIGTNSIWIVTCENRIYFRKGVESSPLGTGWVGPIGSPLSSVSVAHNDQVFGVGAEDRNIYFRVGVTVSEPTGKRWRRLNAGSQLSRGSSVSSLPNRTRHHSTQSLTSVGSIEQCDWQETSRSAPTSLRIQPVWQNPSTSLPASEGSIERPSLSNSELGDEKNDEYNRKLTAWSPIRSVGSLLGLEANPDTDPHAEWDRKVWPEREEPCTEPDWSQAPTLWTQVEAGAIGIPLSNLPNWFDGNVLNVGFQEAPWRLKILIELKEKNQTYIKGYENYDVAVDMVSCIKSVECRCALPASDSWEETCIQLEWVGGNKIDSATLTVLSPEKSVNRCQIALSDMVCLINTSEPGCPQLTVHTLNSSIRDRKPLRILFSGDNDLDDWSAHLTYVACKLMGHEGAPGPNSIWACTKLGDIYVFDHDILKAQQKRGDVFCKEIMCQGDVIPWTRTLENGFTFGSAITVEGFIPEDATRFAIDFRCDNSDIALHVNPRFDSGEKVIVVRNSKLSGSWGKEEREGYTSLEKGTRFSINVFSQEEGFKISFNGMVFTYYEHRIDPDKISEVCVSGGIEFQKFTYESTEVIVPLKEMFWRQMGGHLIAVETCAAGVTWGISADSTPWVYTGGWGGLFLGGLESSSKGINNMTDMYRCYVYENQRWNPLSGFTARGLPTDRPSWSDSTGCHKRSKEATRLLSIHWTWVTDWYVDFLTPGGVDSEGWQYAVDFSTSYHPRKTMTDYVRRRRWARDCKLQTSGPWAETGNTKVKSISLQVSTGLDVICVWAIAVNGDALFRQGVSKSNPMGDSWEHVACEHPLVSISCGCGNQVWAVAESGSACWRFGITTSNPLGEVWESVEPPKGSSIKKVSVGRWAVWVLDGDGKVYVRREVTPVFPEGTHWQAVSHSNNDKFHSISASGDEVWGVTSDGTVCRRTGVTCDDPVGISWACGFQGNWSHVTCRNYTSKTYPVRTRPR